MTRMARPPVRALMTVASLLLGAVPGYASIGPTPTSAAELQLGLERLNVLASVLFIAAHPDDEDTALLAQLARGRLARTVYLSITRGDGGQNLIGTEQGEELGIIRTQELLEARRRDGAEQLFTRAIDFGYTKSVDEALEVWGRDEILGDVVRLVRRLRPDVIIMRFPGDGRGGHGHHTASAVLALEAFDAAADAGRFAEQLGAPEHLAPWRAKRLLWDASRFFGDPDPGSAGVTVDVGGYQPLLGESFTEIAARSRSQHRSQGFGSAGSRGEQLGRLEHRLGEPATADLFDGIDTSWSRIAGGEVVGARVSEALRAFDPRRPAAVVPILVAAYRATRGLGSDPWLERKRAELREVIRQACGLWLEAIADRELAAPGQPLRITYGAVNRSDLELRIERIRSPFGYTVLESPSPLLANRPFQSAVESTVPAGYPISQPYWLEQAPAPGRYRVDDPSLIGAPERLGVRAAFTVNVAGLELDFELPVLVRRTDPTLGEIYRAFAVAPPLSIEVASEPLVFPDTQPRRFEVRLEGGGAKTSGMLRVEVPAGFRVVPESSRFELAADSVSSAAFEITPPDAPSSGVARVTATLDGGGTVDTGRRVIDHSHIPTQVWFPTAESRLVRVELERRGETVGYIMGPGDEVPEALRQVGYQVSLLSDPDLATADLDGYDAIVVGVRAYNARPAVLEHNQRLLEYVRGGGTLVVQYQTVSRRDDEFESIAPYPMQLGRRRVSVEDAPVTMLEPESPLLVSPNRLTAADFDGWHQERGLYFAEQWDPRFVPLLSSNDPGEPEARGGLLVANYGKGVYIFTGYSFFRELPAGVPGALRLFVNLISARQ